MCDLCRTRCGSPCCFVCGNGSCAHHNRKFARGTSAQISDTAEASRQVRAPYGMQRNATIVLCNSVAPHTCTFVKTAETVTCTCFPGARDPPAGISGRLIAHAMPAGEPSVAMSCLCRHAHTFRDCVSSAYGSLSCFAHNDENFTRHRSRRI